MNFKAKVIELWEKDGSPEWGYEETLSACVNANTFFRKRGENPAKKFRKNLVIGDDQYVRNWIMGCHFSWLNPR